MNVARHDMLARVALHTQIAFFPVYFTFNDLADLYFSFRLMGYNVTLVLNVNNLYSVDISSVSTLSSALGKKRVEQVKQSKRLYIKGWPFPVEVRGCFAIMGLEKHRMKRKIIEVFDDFY
jgi:hypothetical protein